MDRRRFLLTSLAGALVAPHAAETQRPSRIAFLCPRSCSALPNVKPTDCPSNDGKTSQV